MGATAQEQGSAEGWSLLQVSGADFLQLREQFGDHQGERADGAVLVGGADAQLVDEESAAEWDRKIIFPLVLALIFGALVIMLRSFLAPVIMVASVLLTNVAAIGMGWWISHYLLGFDRFASNTPLFAFVFLVA
ncbi:MMPL family transporter, partial [Acinetobacter baumannii]|nr:MMPL family transporter [Acinetobacter baumannii]